MTKKEITLRQILESTLTRIKTIDNNYQRVVSSFDIKFVNSKKDIKANYIWIPKFGIKKHSINDYETLVNSKNYDYALIEENSNLGTLFVYYKDNGNPITENLSNKGFFYLTSSRNVKNF